jgi:putrescine importer
MLNFGAFLAFMGVNFSCFTHFYWRAPKGHKRHLLKDAVVPLGGTLFCLWIWCNLSRPALIRGAIWIGAGFLYAAIKTRGFRSKALTMGFQES